MIAHVRFQCKNDQKPLIDVKYDDDNGLLQLRVTIKLASGGWHDMIEK